MIRWCFYINLPVGGLALVTTKLFVHFPPHHKLDSMKFKDKLKYFDLIGVFTVTVSVVCLVLGLQYGGNTYLWSNGRVIALFVLSGVFMIVWVASQIWKKEYALLPMKILGQRSMLSSFVFILFLSSSLVIDEYYVSCVHYHLLSFYIETYIDFKYTCMCSCLYTSKRASQLQHFHPVLCLSLQ